MLENIRLSFQGIFSHKLRSFLTMLGIIIGIGAIIAIVSTIQGTNEQIKKNLVGAGNNTVDVELYQDDYTYEIDYYGLPDGVPVITEDVRQEILAADGVENVSLYTSRQSYSMVYYKNSGMEGGTVKGIDLNYFDTCSYTVEKGRGFDETDFEKYRKVAILDENCEMSLFEGEDPIGKTIEIKGEPYIVIGVVGTKEGYEPVINSMDDYYTYMGDESGVVYIPSSTWPIIFEYDEPQSVVIKAVDTDSMTTAGQAAADILNSYLTVSDSSLQYKGEDLLEQAKEIQQLSESTNQMLIWIAGISLLVGGIGVMNIMLVSVTERTQEIGLKKAIGAKKKHIMMQFLTEAAVLTCLGGVIGVIAGIILAEVISKVSGTPVSISAPAAAVAVVFSMAIGIIFGLLPSYKAANLKPIDALRHE